VRDGAGRSTIVLDGERGRVLTLHGDCAEELDMAPGARAEPGDVMVIDTAGKLTRCSRAYDRRVAGILSGAGDEEPGLLLGCTGSEDAALRRPLALTGRAFCRVDAGPGAIEVGDLLTTSPTPGRSHG